MTDKLFPTVVYAKITYFFKETFRARSKDEYREIFSRGLNENTGGITGAYPWLYVRAFFALFMLFTVNTLVLRLTNNPLYVPSVNFLGGITFTVPFIILLYELYPKRDLSLFILLALLVVGGTASGVLCQLGYKIFKAENKWADAALAGILEETCKAFPAILCILFIKRKNPYACFLIGAAVGAGFSIIEDMGYIFYYSDKYIFYYHSDIQATVLMFADRGMSAFCTHILWTGAIGWTFSLYKKLHSALILPVFLSSILIHTCWDLPLENIFKNIDICLCVAVTAAINIAIVHKSRINTLAEEVDLTHINSFIISEAKAMGYMMKFRNAANLTLTLTCTLLAIIMLALCALPIGMEYQKQEFDTKEDFIEFIQDGCNIKADTDRAYNPDGVNEEEMWGVGDDGNLQLKYAVQKDILEGFDGEYYYGYYIYDGGKTGEIDNIYVVIDDGMSYRRLSSREYKLGNSRIWAFEVNSDKVKEYSYNENGTVSALLDAEEFEGYDVLIALLVAGCAISAVCAVILISFRIKLRREINEGL